MVDIIPGLGADQGMTGGVVTPAAPVSKSRRTMLKGSVAVAGGVVAAGYVKPGLRSLGVPGALAQVSPGPGTQIFPPPGGWAEVSPGDWKTTGGTFGPQFWNPLIADGAWGGAEAQPFFTTDVFGVIFTPSPDPALNDLNIETLIETIANSGGGPAFGAAFQLVAATLTAAWFGWPGSPNETSTPFPFSVQQLKDAWTYAVDNVGTQPTIYTQLQTILDAANHGDYDGTQHYPGLNP